MDSSSMDDLEDDLDYSRSSVESGSSDITIRARMENTIQHIQLARRLADEMSNGRRSIDPFRSPESLYQDEVTMKLNHLMNSRLARDDLPEDTPLPVYLSYREPRGVSPPSHWDSPDPHKRCRH
ncbi:uncharacterized protein [Drosophila bipectinata]|uniref:uncharacterized protein n=1 Tax=Drosophila bipectinata TaxID=42026 RepID=UPI0007E858E5|nr:uncharacterized protein LOC108134315 [Drosophila bipectinata]XP_017110066.1 uncharacterized protein LOC108134315 [Drosophila bipectinata]